ncbi:MAG: hypothetical protein SH809_01920 [Rhodothermales bacterium]|nr:hypothetical protein [Rhodothermales bacterium]
MNESILTTSWRSITLVLGVFLLLLGATLAGYAVVPGKGLSGSLGGATLAFDLSDQSAAVRSTWFGTGILGVLLSLLLLRIGFARIGQRGKQVILSDVSSSGAFGSGRVSIAIDSLTALLVHVAERVEGIREIDPKLQMTKKGWRLDCVAAITPDALMPSVTSALKAQLKDTLEQHTGLPVATVNISAQLLPIRNLKRVR